MELGRVGVGWPYMASYGITYGILPQTEVNILDQVFSWFVQISNSPSLSKSYLVIMFLKSQ